MKTREARRSRLEDPPGCSKPSSGAGGCIASLEVDLERSDRVDERGCRVVDLFTELVCTRRLRNTFVLLDETG